MNKAARKAVNLSVLQRHDPHISDIIDSSSYVVVYKFDEDSQTWTKKGVEGTMFVFKRSTLPSYGFFIMNRLGLDNLMADLTADMALQLTSDYIIYRDDKDIHGIWIYEPTDRDRIGEKLMDCCKRAKEETQGSQKPPLSSPEGQSSAPRPMETSTASASTEPAPVDPLLRMLSDAMSKARVSESSGVPSTPQSHQQNPTQGSSTSSNPSPLSLSASGKNESNGADHQSSQQADSTSGNEIPSFLLAIISKDKGQPSSNIDASPLQTQQSPKVMNSTQSMLLNSLTGAGKNTSGERASARQHGPPLSAEFLPASVMPSGLYSNTGMRPDGGPADQGMSPHVKRSSASSSMSNATMMNPQNGLPAHASPLSAPAFAYSPGMMPSPLIMPPIPGGPMMHPPPPPMNGGPHPPPPPPLAFQHHPGLVGRPHAMGMPPQPPMAGSGFPADAMHAAMGAVGFMQQQQRGFVGHGTEVMPKAEFAQQFQALVQNDPQFMDVLYSNYAAVFARRG
ncbi:hypothetical protein BGZ51_000719 [Haplosporangium sp. Z 767]|nr:hypothetical protein BGZ50_001511 [Haplosporangium sp. Z 11]KAF9188258.1 hypothetical protein BGZ51_000719 [Haplosporangium sp. Z 767]